MLPLLYAAGAGCGGLQLKLYNASVQKPSQVVLYFSVETHKGAPVGGLEATSFRIYEDEQLISPFESKQTILNPEVAVVHYTLLLLDLSGSITESGSTDALIGSAGSFAERITKREKIGVWGFDGSQDLIPLVSFTGSGASVSRGLAALSSRKTKDPSTNLNGAVINAIALLEKELSRASQPLKFGTLVIFTDGTDRAHRVTEEDLMAAVDYTSFNIFVIGLGAEISEPQLRRLGRAGFIRAEQLANVSSAFEQVAARIEASAKKFYLLSYCSPSRAASHKLRVEAHAMNDRGSLSHDFNAEGFGPDCDPKRPPTFKVSPFSKPAPPGSGARRRRAGTRR